MSLLAESLVEEWLNRAGYFTIRGARFGVSEMDLLAVRPGSEGLEARHIEQARGLNLENDATFREFREWCEPARAVLDHAARSALAAA